MSNQTHTFSHDGVNYQAAGTWYNHDVAAFYVSDSGYSGVTRGKVYVLHGFQAESDHAFAVIKFTDDDGARRTKAVVGAATNDFIPLVTTSAPGLPAPDHDVADSICDDLGIMSDTQQEPPKHEDPFTSPDSIWEAIKRACE